MTNNQTLFNLIIDKRKQLIKCANTYGFHDKRTIKISEELDILIIKVQKMDRKQPQT